MTMTDTIDNEFVITAEQVFDGYRVLPQHAVLVKGDRITDVVPTDQATGPGRRIEIAGTLLPGFIDLHAHVLLDRTPLDVVLRHGLTTVRDTGGPLRAPSGGDGRLRVLSAGPILTAPGGYPIPIFGPDAAWEVPDPDAARAAVRHHVEHGAALIKIALEPGGSAGAPWSAHSTSVAPPWPLPSLEVVTAIVDEAHAHGRRVAAHVSGIAGVELALAAEVDEWAHVPCDLLPDELIARAAAAGVRIVGTLDTQSRTAGVFGNAVRLTEAGVRLLYGTDLAHPDVPWGIDAFELQLMQHIAHGALTAADVLSAATARAGEHLGLAPLGQLVPGAPADLIGVSGNALERFKSLEYPDLVMSGGVVVTDASALADVRVSS
ncbi:amidohydrolase family protein [Nocardia cyriacigeorgica]|uniref:amidohydrolase family protein n=2 Tax=Nocardia cyriacigeorgica TaxID=135487 RepID=UPI0018958E1F